jgi:hypothetical protein
MLLPNRLRLKAQASHPAHAPKLDLGPLIRTAGIIRTNCITSELSRPDAKSQSQGLDWNVAAVGGCSGRDRIPLL